MHRREDGVGGKEAAERARHETERAQAEIGETEEKREAARRHGVSTRALSLS